MLIGILLTHIVELAAQEALDVLRSLKDAVTLHVCRTSDENQVQQILRKHCAGLEWRPQTDQPLPPVTVRQIQFLPDTSFVIMCQEFTLYTQTQTLDVQLRKSHGSLGFTLRKETESRRCRRGHHISALVREPATTDGRLRVGDQIVAVNGVAIGRLTHEEAVMVLRAADEALPVRLELCRSQDVMGEKEGCDDEAGVENISEDCRPPARHMLRAHAVRRLNALADRSKVFCYEDIVTAC